MNIYIPSLSFNVHNIERYGDLLLLLESSWSGLNWEFLIFNEYLSTFHTLTFWQERVFLIYPIHSYFWC